MTAFAYFSCRVFKADCFLAERFKVRWLSAMFSMKNRIPLELQVPQAVGQQIEHDATSKTTCCSLATSSRQKCEER